MAPDASIERAPHGPLGARCAATLFDVSAMSDDADSPEVWDAALAASLPRKVVLVGIAYLAEDGSLIDQQQFFGVVESVHTWVGISLSLQCRRGGEKYNLPPHTGSIRTAAPGEYRPRSSGEIVVDPDYTVTFSLHKQRPCMTPKTIGLARTGIARRPPGAHVNVAPHGRRTTPANSMRVSSVVCGIGLALLLSGKWAPAQTTSTSSPFITDPSYTKPDRLVDVGGGQMRNIRCRGSGSPAVIFDAGLGDDSVSWAAVQPTIARTTRACAYDRAGLGFSDGHAQPSTAANNAEDLQKLLQAAQVEPPYVMVAHSSAGMYARVFADRHPQEVAGMVLVESSHEDQSSRGWAIGPPGQKEKWDAYLDDSGACVALARAGLVKGTPAYEKCVGPPDERFSAEINEVQAALSTTPRWQAAADSERRAVFYASAEETRATRKRFGDIPLIVLTHSPYPKRDDETQEERDKRTLLWESLHTDIAAMSTRGVNIIVPSSGHYIQYDQPQVVIDAIFQAVMLVRQR